MKRATFNRTCNFLRIKISIHALVKRATACVFNGCVLFFISIHALVKRATGTSCISAEVLLNFNPRPREEGDQSALDGGLCLWISIHALVKRATSRKYAIWLYANISIHALVKRATAVADCVKHVNAYFNPRPREEGDYTMTSCA